MMKKLFAIAAFLLVSTAAQAQYTFEYGGRTIRIDPDRGTVSIPGVYDNSGRKQSARTAIRTATVRANRRLSRRKSIRRRQLQALHRPKRSLSRRTLHRSLQPPRRASRQRIPSLLYSLRPADARFSRTLPPSPSPHQRLPLRPLRRRHRRRSPRPRQLSRQIHRSACG